MATAAAARVEGEDYQVLLFYKYTAVRDPAALRDEQAAICRELGLAGRLRVAREGVNGNLGGPAGAVAEYVRRLRANPRGRFDDTDFKRSGACPAGTTLRDPTEQRMAGLTVKVTQELVSLGPGARGVDVRGGGRHLSPQGFHAMLAQGSGGGGTDDDDATNNSSVVLLDTRNVYETRIGRFQVPGVETVDPDTRQFSDLPRRFQDPALMERLRGRKILMYCTGGVRCERASALLKSYGEGFDQVYQLSGGIHRYVEQYGAGGYFRGRNFVFDDRMSTGAAAVTPSSSTAANADAAAPAAPAAAAPAGSTAPQADEVVGSCCMCTKPFDDYTLDCRCSRCRMRILVCPECHAQQQRRRQRQEPKSTPLSAAAQGAGAPAVNRICELCAAKEGGAEGMAAGTAGAAGAASSVGRPVRLAHILCLHDVGGSAVSCGSALKRISVKLKKQATFAFAQAPFTTTLPARAAAAPRTIQTWFVPEDETPPATAAAVAAVLDAVAAHFVGANLPAVDGILGIGEGAGAAALCVALAATGSQACRMKVAGGSAAADDDSDHAAVRRRQAVLERLCGELKFGVLINGCLPDEHAPWVASCLPSGLPCTGGGIPTLHVDLRTRQQNAVYGVRPPRSAQSQQEAVSRLWKTFHARGQKVLWCRPEVGGSGGGGGGEGGRQKKQKGRKRRKRSHRRGGGGGGGSVEDGATAADSGAFECQPAQAIRNFAVIEALRSFLLPFNRD